jgi:hypothetical protein
MNVIRMSILFYFYLEKNLISFVKYRYLNSFLSLIFPSKKRIYKSVLYKFTGNTTK